MTSPSDLVNDHTNGYHRGSYKPHPMCPACDVECYRCQLPLRNRTTCHAAGVMPGRAVAYANVTADDWVTTDD